MFGTPFGLLGLSELGLLKNPRWDRGQIADELRWGNRYFHHMVRPDGGLMDHVVVPVRWERRDVYPNDPPVCATYLHDHRPGRQRPLLEGQGSRP